MGVNTLLLSNFGSFSSSAFLFHAGLKGTRLTFRARQAHLQGFAGFARGQHDAIIVHNGQGLAIWSFFPIPEVVQDALLLHEFLGDVFPDDVQEIVKKS